MTFRTVTKNYRIEVIPQGSDGFHTRDDEHDARILMDIVQAAVRTHYEGGSVRLRSDTFSACSFCGCPEDGSVIASEEDADAFGEPIGYPVCCEAAQAEWRAEMIAKETS